MKRKPSKDTLIKQFKILTDNREQKPWVYGKQTTYGTLQSGDYSVIYDDKLYSNHIIIERKSSVGELYSASGKGRDRFERELERLLSVPYRWVVCEFDFLRLVNDPPPGLLEPSAVYGTIISWHVKYNVPFIFCGNRQNARAFTWKVLYNFTKYKILGGENV